MKNLSISFHYGRGIPNDLIFDIFDSCKGDRIIALVDFINGFKIVRKEKKWKLHKFDKYAKAKEKKPSFYLDISFGKKKPAETFISISKREKFLVYGWTPKGYINKKHWEEIRSEDDDEYDED